MSSDDWGHSWGASYDGDIVECMYCGVKVGGKWAHQPCDAAPGVRQAQREGRWVWQEYPLPEDFDRREKEQDNG